MIPFSVLDLAPMPEGATAAEALANTLDLARHAEDWGYRRFWLAEHHNMPGIASAATAVVIGAVAAATRTIRVGAGGIMLPNHAPLIVAEAFGTLATLYPGRIDLGLGRAPGTDMATMRALRRHMDGADRFPQDVVELLGYLGRADPGRAVRAIPGEGTGVPVWILGSSLYGAQLAAHLGLPYAFASHFAPGDLEPAIAVYRAVVPAVALAGGAAADAGGQRLRRRQRRRGAAAALLDAAGLRQPAHRRPRAAAAAGRGHRGAARPVALAMAERALACSAVGRRRRCGGSSPASSSATRPDELILTGQIHDHAARLRSFEIAAEVLAEGQRAPA